MSPRASSTSEEREKRRRSRRAHMIVVMVMIRVRVCRAYRLEWRRRRLRPVRDVVALLASPEREDRHWGVLVMVVMMMVLVVRRAGERR